jgi:hypothetical protein
MYSKTLQAIEASGSTNSSVHYADSYLYLKSIVDEKINSMQLGDAQTDLKRLSIWLGRAASINSNDGSFSSEFVRGSTEAFAAMEGHPANKGIRVRSSLIARPDPECNRLV